MPEKALVTGGGGFLGSEVVRRLLARGDAVRVLGRSRYPALEALGAECVQGDLGDRDAVAAACAGVDVVHHVGALAGAWGKAADFERTNVHGTEHVVAGCRAAGVGRLVFTSSPSVISPPDFHDHDGVDERCPYPERYLAHYPRTKAQAERIVLAANGESLRTCALRPHLIYGVGDPHIVPRLFTRARKKKLRRVGDGPARIDFTRVENAAIAHLLAADDLAGKARSAGNAYFITNGEPVALWDWVAAFLEGVGLPPVTKQVSSRAAFRLGGALELAWKALRLGGEPPMTRFVAVQLATSHWFTIDAARRDLGYAPEAFPLAPATEALIAHYKAKLAAAT
ncbi:MAG: NAD-dependent epimerase/dehydratase family protein [Planctomycetes bacterium]|nr:NAD-dependent epimerase/dehydratase family protein [Planctomycetota bacterium]